MASTDCATSGSHMCAEHGCIRLLGVDQPESCQPEKFMPSLGLSFGPTMPACQVCHPNVSSGASDHTRVWPDVSHYGAPWGWSMETYNIRARKIENFQGSPAHGLGPTSRVLFICSSFGTIDPAGFLALGQA